MIIRDEAPKARHLSKVIWLLVPVALAFLVTSDRKVPMDHMLEQPQEPEILFLNTLEQHNESHFIAGNYHFEGAAWRTDSIARSEPYSIELNKDQIYGLTTVFTPTNYSTTYRLSAWRYNPMQVDSWLVASAADANDFYLAIKESSQEDEAGWELLEMFFQIPDGLDHIKLYCYAGGDGASVYFDDFQLESIDYSDIADSVNIAEINLELSGMDLEKLQAKRDAAWAKGVLVTEDDDWVSGKLTTGDQSMPIKLRLKGDWLDHLKGRKWSYRVKVRKENALWGMKTFNLQRPETRGFLREWIYHYWLEQEDVLTTRYRFVLVKINDQSMGLYAMEEHFEKELVESRNRREGPILKFNEDSFWASVLRQFESEGKNQLSLPNTKKDALHAADVAAFKESTIAAKPDLSKQFVRAVELMKGYKDGTDTLSRLLDAERLGKYLAIIDVTGAYHSLTWHNQRWYYDPLADHLEPVGYDGFTEAEPILHAGSTFLVDEVFRQKAESFEPYHHLFRDARILESYVRHLRLFTDDDYRRNLFEPLLAQIDLYGQLFRYEYPRYSFDLEEYRTRSARIRLSLQPYPGQSLLVRQDEQSRALLVDNRHHLPMKILQGYDIANRPVAIEPVLIYPNVLETIPTIIRSQRSVAEVSYTVPGLDSIFRQPVIKTSMVRLSDETKPSVEDHPLCRIVDNQVILRSGATDRSIVIGPGREVVIPAGTVLDLHDNAYLISASPVLAQGQEDQPIRIHSSDGTGALLIRDAAATSQFKYGQFDGLGRVDQNGFVLTGGFTCYETKVDISHCIFSNSKQEDALNLVRSEFDLADCLFQNTAFDALDVDFSRGSIRGCIFRDTGNDAMDFSGSTVDIAECQMSNIGDKGISVGEKSTVSASDIDIAVAVTGVASKDYSDLVVKGLKLTDVTTGLTAFRKKETYGPARITVEGLTEENVKHLHIIEAGSSLTLDNVTVATN